MRKKRLGMVLGVAAVCLLSGCAANTPEDDKIVLIESEVAPIEYSMGVTSVTDVVALKNVSCVYQQVNDWNGFFEVSGKQVGKVYVEKGDMVTEGQLLAELNLSDTEQKIKELEYRIERNKIRLEYLEQTRDSKIQQERFKYANYPGWEEWENKSFAEVEAEIQLEYQYEIEDCQDAIVADEAKLPALVEERKTSKLYAGMDGQVTYIRQGLQGAYCRENQTVITVTDDTKKVFEVKEPEYGRYFMTGTVTDMTITVGEGKGDYELVPFEMEKWGESLYFSIKSGGEDAAVTLGDSGTMKVVTGKKTDVLAVPALAVHRADNREFVYVVGESGLRELKWIETGLHGKDYVEVFGGLEEGDKVVLQ